MTDGSIRIGVLGGGTFADRFIPLYQAHPLVAEVQLAERLPDRRDALANRHGVATVHKDFDGLLAADLDAIAIFTQRWTHAPLAIRALRAGKHVYSAVPAAVTLEELEQLIEAVRETGQLYMLGETTYYEAPTILCRKLYRRGAFGRFVYAEADYCHDMEHNFYPPYQGANGPGWKKFASFPPMLYPTHSVGQMLGVTGGRMLRAACFGQVDRHNDAIFDRGLSHFDNDFSNQSALFHHEDGAMCRANEFRRVTGGRPLVVQGTRSAFQYPTWLRHDRTKEDLAETLSLTPYKLPDDWEEQRKAGAQEDFFCGMSAIHDVERLPPSFRGLPNGHGGSHHFLADDFVQMCAREQTPPMHVWTAARFCAPGIVAHESSRRDGETLAIPDFGGPPDGLALFDVEDESGKPPPEALLRVS